MISVGDGLWGFRTAADLGLAFVGIGTGEKAQALRGLGAMVAADYRDPGAMLDMLAG